MRKQYNINVCIRTQTLVPQSVDRYIYIYIIKRKIKQQQK